MDVLIHTIGSAVPTAPARKNAPNESAEKSSPGGTVSPEDSVEASLKLQVLTESVMTAPIVDESRVSRLSSAVANGHYQVDPQRAANRLMELEALTP